ncbi:hypothetical protein KY290_021098 [Solanum tuberosum]|uniref:Retrotransposon Copia-like N-terminal domain-containing protein n=1 Tax=Solanum tuberosum TaxID=4113 RepID=A0ABQ7V0J5_SOLTU|nr:hypothetical protein KY289_022811 [Solanum tuberosum]KAH0692935.1 hypothetical protein KY285_020032 [Solanum tuberosum]KAH0757605.1 hypothetical protein KY290_021098 [Solanum tuberosum]
MGDSSKNTNTVLGPITIPFGVKLNGKNYSLWSQVVVMFIASRGKMGYLSRTIKEPLASDATYEKWSRDNSIVKCWLVGAMEPDIMSLFVCLSTAKSIWDTVSQSYYEGADRSVIYDLSCQAMYSSMAMAAKVSLVQNQNYHSKARNNDEKGCTHCGSPKHALENCFKLHGYPDWWNGLNKKNYKERRNPKDGDKNDGKAAAMVSTSTSLPTAGTTLDLNSKEIIGRGTKRGGLYYVDDVCRGISLMMRLNYTSVKKYKRSLSNKEPN